MCMFYETPKQTRIAKPITAYKVFMRNGNYPFQGRKPKTNTWLRAKAPKGERINEYGFHVFTDKRDAVKFKRNWWGLGERSYVVRKVKIRGTVYGIGRFNDYPSGMRVLSLFIPKRKTKKK